MPEIWPITVPLTDAVTPWSPAEVLAVCEPWPSKSRGEWNSPGRLSPRPARLYHRAPMTLLLQATWLLSPASHVPANLLSMIAWSGRGSDSGAKLAFSGQKPVSMTPTMTPSPVYDASGAPVVCTMYSAPLSGDAAAVCASALDAVANASAAIAAPAIASVSGRVSPARRVNDTGPEPPCLRWPRAGRHGAAPIRRHAPPDPGGLASPRLAAA